MAGVSEGLDGYVLFSPLLSTTTYLVDRRGRVVHSWQSGLPPAISVYLLPNGHLLRSARNPDSPVFPSGYGGRIQELTWEGEVVWDWAIPSPRRLQHHDLEPLPGGNVLLIAWDAKTRTEAIRAGRMPQRVGPAGLWSDCVLEVRPQYPDGGAVVWEWCAWDHLIQDFDPRREGYGAIAEHPERIDVNGDRRQRRMTEELLARLRALGYVGDDSAPADSDADFLHTNAIAYHPRLDQIALSVPTFHEIWIIDHGTTTREAAGHSGGRYGRGGDLLYRWGNPRAYGRGEPGDQRLFAQHDARWIPEGYPGGGHLTVFNNGNRRRPFSSVVEIVPPLAAGGGYALARGRPFGPARPAWEYTAPEERSFYAEFISGAHRLRNGDTLVTDGPRGRFFEVTAGGDTVWEYQNAFVGDAPNPLGDPPFSVFRATWIPPDHPGVAGQPLGPLAPQPPAGEPPSD